MSSYKASHSEHMIQAGYLYIPHPLYDEIEFEQPPQKKIYYVIFGSITPYKGIENVIENWDLNAELLIVGSCDNQEYLEHLILLSQSKNVTINADYISEPEAATLVSGAQAMILPHMGDEMIVSGSYYFAVSFKTPVIVLKNQFYEFLKDKYNLQHIIILDSFHLLSSLDMDSILFPENEYQLMQKISQSDWLSKIDI